MLDQVASSGPLVVSLSTSTSLLLQTALTDINGRLETLAHHLEAKSFFDSQVFAALIGAAIALLLPISHTFFNWKKLRDEKMNELYHAILSDAPSFSPENLVSEAGMHMYGHTRKGPDGTVTSVPEKALAEKTCIQFRRKIKYWKYPYSRLRWLLGRYNIWCKALPKQTRSEIKTSVAYNKMEKIHSQIIGLCKRQTGEDEWTIR